MKSAAEIKDALAHHYGSATFVRHPLKRDVLITEGVQALMDMAECHWLADIIVSYQFDPKVRAEEFQVWKLRKPAVAGKQPDGNANFSVRDRDSQKLVGYSARLWNAVVWVEDGNETGAIVAQAIEYTDFPLDEIDIWFENGTMMMPSER